MFVLVDDRGPVVHARDLRAEEAVRLRLRVALLAARRVFILLGARHLLLHAHVLRRLAERDRVIAEIDHARIHQAPAERRVVQHALASRECLRWLERDLRCARHALDPAGDHDVRLAVADTTRRVVHGFEPRTAQAIHGDAGHRVGKAREERGHAPDVPVVLAGLVRRAEHDLVDLIVADVGAFEDGADDVRGKIVGAEGCECATIAADGRADVAEDHRIARVGGSRGAKPRGGRHPSIFPRTSPLSSK